MALVGAFSFIASTAFEAASVMEVELTMFAVAALVYVACVGGLRRPSRYPSGKKLPAKTPVPTPQEEQQTGASRKLRTASPPTPSGRASEVQKMTAKIKSCLQRKDLAGARVVMKELRLSGAPASTQVYNAFLEACVNCGDVEAALKAFEEMKELGVMDVVGYNTVIKAMLAQGRVEEARGLLAEMAQRGMPPNKITYNELLLNRVMAKDRRGMWSVVDEIREAGLQVSVVSCSILLKSLAPQSTPWEIKRVLKLIDQVEEPLDEVLLCSVVDSCIRLQHLELLSDFLERQGKTSLFASCPAPVFGSMIKAYGQAGDIAQARALWRKMEALGVEPTDITLGCIVQALVTGGLADEALELLHEQLRSSRRRDLVNTVIYSTVLKGFALARQFDKVFAVYDEMLANGVSCNTITYNTMLDACAKGGGMRRAKALMEDMKQFHVEPDLITFSTLVKGYCSEGDVVQAFAILDEMQLGGQLSPDEIMYNSILDGCAKQKRTQEALKILDNMKAAGIRPSNYTLSILVKLLGHAGRLNQAFRMVEELSKESGFRPNIQVYTCLVQACANNRQLDRAFVVYDAAVADKKCNVDEKFYAVLARCCLQVSQPLRAVEVVRAAFGLPRGCLATAQNGTKGFVGMEERALNEVMARLQRGSVEEKRAQVELAAELSALRSRQQRHSGPVGNQKQPVRP